MGKDSFTARNDSQTYFCRSLALAYIEVGPCHRNHEILLLLFSLAGCSAVSAVWCVCVCVCVCVRERERARESYCVYAQYLHFLLDVGFVIIDNVQCFELFLIFFIRYSIL